MKNIASTPKTTRRDRDKFEPGRLWMCASLLASSVIPKIEISIDGKVRYKMIPPMELRYKALFEFFTERGIDELLLILRKESNPIHQKIAALLEKSSYVLSKYPRQFPAHFIGRLLQADEPEIQTLVKETREFRGHEWLEPISEVFTRDSLIKCHKIPAGPIESFYLLPDEDQVLLFSIKRFIILHNLETGQNLHLFEELVDQVTALGLSPDAKTLALALENHKIQIHELTSSEPRKILEGHTGTIRQIIVGKDIVLSSAEDSALRVWDLASGELRFVLPLLLKLHSHEEFKDLLYSEDDIYRRTDWAARIALSPDGKRAVSFALNHQTILWDLERGRAERELVPARHLVYRDSSDTSAVNETYAVRKNYETGENRIPPHRLCWSLDGRRLVSMSPADAYFWDTATWKNSNNFAEYSEEFRDVFLLNSRDSYALLHANEQPRSYILGSSHMNFLEVRDSRASPAWSFYRRESDKTFTRVLISEKRQRAILAQEEGGLRIISLPFPDGISKKNFRYGNYFYPEDKFKIIDRLMFAPDGEFAVSADRLGRVKLWDVNTGENIKPAGPEDQTIRGEPVAFLEKGKVLLTKNGTFRLWEIPSGKNIKSLPKKNEGNSFLFAKVSSDEKRLISGSNRGVLAVRDIETGETNMALTRHGLGRVSLFTSDNRFMIIDGRDSENLFSRLKLIDISTFRTRRVFLPFSAGLSANNEPVRGDYAREIALSSDGARLIAWTSQDKIQVWDFATGELEFVVDDLALLPDTIQAGIVPPAEGRGIFHAWEIYFTNKAAEGLPHEAHFSAESFMKAMEWQDNLVLVGDVEGKVFLFKFHGEDL